MSKKKGNSQQNTFTILEDYLLKTWDFRYNEVRNEIEYKLKTEKVFKQINDSDIYVHLKKNNIPFKTTDLKEILKSSIIEPYNPILKYFQSLPEWDKKTDYIDSLISHINYSGIIDLKMHFKKWLVRAVKCAIDPNYFNKQILVLIGKQSDGKSTFIRFLVPDSLKNYYSENPDFKSKDGEISLTQNFIINMDELANIGKEDTDKLKTFISKVTTNIRRPYATNTKSEPRRASFAGTTNNDEFLIDHTGNVRWLNFKIDGINFEYSKKIKIDNVWSQAFALFNDRNFKYEINKDEENQIETNNNDFKIQTMEMQAIKEHFDVPYKQDLNLLKFFTAMDIVSHLHSLNEKLYKNLNVQKVGRAMISLGFKKESQRKENSNSPVKGYYVYLK